MTRAAYRDARRRLEVEETIVAIAFGAGCEGVSIKWPDPPGTDLGLQTSAHEFVFPKPGTDLREFVENQHREYLHRRGKMMSETNLHRVVVTAIVHRKRDGTGPMEYLIVRRAKHLAYRPGEWTVPGGGIKLTDWHDETTQGEEDAYGVLKIALAREIAEECGAGFTIGRPWLMDDYAFMRGDGVPVLGLSYVADWIEGDVVLDDENDLLRWVTIPESKVYNLIPDIHGELEKAALVVDNPF